MKEHIFNKTSEIDKRRSLRKRLTLAETLLWEALRNRKLEGLKFRRQYSIGSYVVDFYCSEKKIA
jgi:very-short-patch-repair endonuclease